MKRSLVSYTSDTRTKVCALLQAVVEERVFIAHLFLLGLGKATWSLCTAFTVRYNPAEDAALAARGSCPMQHSCVSKHIQLGLYTQTFNTPLALHELSPSAYFNKHSCPQAGFNIPKPGTTWNMYSCHHTEACDPAFEWRSLGDRKSQSKILRWHKANIHSHELLGISICAEHRSPHMALQRSLCAHTAAPS